MRPKLLKGPLSPEEEALFKKRSVKYTIVITLALMALFAIVGVTEASSVGDFLLVQAAISGFFVVMFPLNLWCARLSGRLVLMYAGRKAPAESDGAPSV